MVEIVYFVFIVCSLMLKSDCGRDYGNYVGLASSCDV